VNVGLDSQALQKERKECCQRQQSAVEGLLAGRQNAHVQRKRNIHSKAGYAASARYRNPGQCV
jgi:hypothetical protein